jgi:hypothetical protein
MLFFVNHSDFSKVFKFKFVHLGGDEVNTSKFAEISCSLHSSTSIYIFIIYYEFQVAGLPHRALKHGMHFRYP